MHQETLKHDSSIGEVDPRTYPLLGEVRFACDRIGTTERISQANRLIYAVDKVCEQEGEPRIRVHLTMAPGVDPRQRVEVRIQPLTQRSEEADVELANRVKSRWHEIMAKSEGRWISV